MALKQSKGFKSKKKLLQNGTQVGSRPEKGTPLFKLQTVYKNFILPLEEKFHFGRFFSPSLSDSDLSANPIILCIGQYSTGKTSFIKFLLERDFPGIRIGPQPTTDRFVAVMEGKTEKLVPGNAAAAQNEKPFTSLESFGISFLNKFEVSELSSPILKRMIFIDTPGILASSDSNEDRNYDFIKAIRWFAERADRILLFFDSNKLDISNPMEQAINAIKCNEDKLVCILNKADSVSSQQLMRVYGALMWSLGKSLRFPEPLRVYVGSFWEGSYQNEKFKQLFDAEKIDLLTDLRGLKRQSIVRKLNEIMKRTKLLNIHILILVALKSKMGLFGKEKKKKKLINDLESVFDQIETEHNLPRCDFPSVSQYQSSLGSMDFKFIKKFSKNDKKDLEFALSSEMPKILELATKLHEEANKSVTRNPFEVKEGESLEDLAGNKRTNTPIHDDSIAQRGWAISGGLKKKFDGSFERYSENGKNIPGDKAKSIMLSSGLEMADLKKIWDLSDIDKDNALDRDEFAVCFQLIELFKEGNAGAIGDELPYELIPPSKRQN